VILDAPELHLSGNVLVPDLAGWRRERLPEAPNSASVDVAPDWVCEVLSPESEHTDRGKKLRVYATERVSDVWFVGPATQTLEVRGLNNASYRILDVFEGNSAVRAVPFDAIELELGVLWAR
jgi:Uma2 family endonuclease